MAQRIVEVTLFVDVDVESNEVTVQSYEVAGGTSADIQLAARAMDAALPRMFRDSAQQLGYKLVADTNNVYCKGRCAICGGYIDPGFGVCMVQGTRAVVCDLCADQLDPDVRDLASVVESYDGLVYDAPKEVRSAFFDMIGEGVSTSEYTSASLTKAINKRIEEAGGLLPTIDNPHPYRTDDPYPYADSDVDDIPF